MRRIPTGDFLNKLCARFLVLFLSSILSLSSSAFALRKQQAEHKTGLEEISRALTAGGSASLTAGLEEGGLKPKEVRILVANDMKLALETDVDLVKKALGRSPYGKQFNLDAQVYAAPDGGATTVQWVQENKPQLVITDYNMPGGDGVEVAEAAKRANPAAVVIMVSGEDPSKNQRIQAALKSKIIDRFIGLSDDEAVSIGWDAVRQYILSKLSAGLEEGEVQEGAVLEEERQGAGFNGRGAFGVDQWRKGLPLEGKPTGLLPEQTTFYYSPFSSGASRQASDSFTASIVPHSLNSDIAAAGPSAGSLRTGLEEYEVFEARHRTIMDFGEKAAFGKHKVGTGKEAREETNAYYGEAIWAAWTAILDALRQVKPFYTSKRGELFTLLNQDFEQLARYYQAHYETTVGEVENLGGAQASGKIKEMRQSPPQTWLDLFGRPLTWETVQSLADQNEIAYGIETSGWGESGRVTVLIEKPSYLMEKVKQDKETLPGPAQLGENLYLIGARVFVGQGGKAYRHVQQGKMRVDRRQAQVERVATHEQTQGPRSAFEMLRAELLYPAVDDDPDLNHLRNIRRRLANHPQREFFNREDVKRVLFRTLHLTHAQTDDVLAKAWRISAEQPFASEGDVDTMIAQVNFFLAHRSKAANPVREILARIDRNESPTGKFGQAVAYVVKQVQAGETDTAKLRSEVLKSFGARSAAGLEELKDLALENVLERLGKLRASLLRIQVYEKFPDGWEDLVADLIEAASPLPLFQRFNGLAATRWGQPHQKGISFDLTLRSFPGETHGRVDAKVVAHHPASGLEEGRRVTTGPDTRTSGTAQTQRLTVNLNRVPTAKVAARIRGLKPITASRAVVGLVVASRWDEASARWDDAPLAMAAALARIQHPQDPTGYLFTVVARTQKQVRQLKAWGVPELVIVPGWKERVANTTSLEAREVYEKAVESAASLVHLLWGVTDVQPLRQFPRNVVALREWLRTLDALAPAAAWDLKSVYETIRHASASFA